MIDIDNLIKNPSKGETYDDVEKTIANQMARFTSMLTDSKNPIEDFKTICEESHSGIFRNQYVYFFEGKGDGVAEKGLIDVQVNRGEKLTQLLND